MNLRQLFFLLFFVAAGASSLAQNAEVSGKIIDGDSKETLPFANIFINNTTIGTAANENGDFTLKNVPFGVHELVVSYVGYKPLQASIQITSERVGLGLIEMAQSEQELANVEVTGKKDTGWEKQLKKFKKTFLGEDKLAEQCEILNPYVIDFSKEQGGTLTASASEPIEISNLSLGYKLSFYLTQFQSDKDSYSIRGQVRFSEISTKGGATALQWMNNREDAYVGSQQHLFRALLEKRLQDEGFYLYTDKEGYENNTYRTANFIVELGNTIMPYDTNNIVFPGEIPNTYKILMKGRVEVHCRAEEAKQRTYNDIPYQVSWIEVEGDTVVVNKNGSVLNPQAVVTSGAINSSRVAEMLPLDYKPGKVVRIKREPRGIEASRLEEKIYIHMDKPYYYPGEMMWFKAYFNYRYPEKRDSMSRTMYVELISPHKKIVKSQIVRVDNGFAHSNWVVTDTLSAGTYWLRAYTNLNRNFDKDYFVKPIPILGKTEQVVASEIFIEPTQKHAVTVRLDQRSYGTRDSIGLILSVRDTLGKPLLSNLSVSVTDARQVLPVKPPFTILDKYPFRSEPDHRIIDEVAFPVEYGVSYEGQYLNRRGKPEKATLSILQGNYEHLSVIETDENGLFVETGLQFYDSTDFRFQTKNTKKKYDGRVEIVAREIPALDSQLPSFDLKTINTGKNQRLISEYEVPRGARLLSEILIQGQREDMEKIRPYGKPDFVVNADDLDISSNNLLIILQGKVPGIVISYLSDDSGTHPVVRIARASGLTIKAQTEPMVMIDNVPMSGRAGDILQSINAYTVESIEVVTRVSPAYGSAGVNGVISIYTKRGVGSNYKPIDRSLQTVKMRGYARPDLFRYPNYSNQDSEKNQIDYRSILYWNPFVATDETGIAKVSFYSGDLETRYRVVVEGITENNQPVRGVGYITIENDKQ